MISDFFWGKLTFIISSIEVFSFESTSLASSSISFLRIFPNKHISESSWEYCLIPLIIEVAHSIIKFFGNINNNNKNHKNNNYLS